MSIGEYKHRRSIGDKYLRITRLIKIISCTTVLAIFIINPVWLYIYNKTAGKWNTDCMIQYVKYHYPNWCEYLIEWKYQHIDKCWMENELMKLVWKVEWCSMTQAKWVNTPYCNTTLLLETILKYLD